MCYSSNVEFPYHEKFMSEIRRLELVQGKKVDHPSKGSKDCADAVAGAVYNAVESEGLKRFSVSIH